MAACGDTRAGRVARQAAAPCRSSLFRVYAIDLQRMGVPLGGKAGTAAVEGAGWLNPVSGRRAIRYSLRQRLGRTLRARERRSSTGACRNRRRILAAQGSRSRECAADAIPYALLAPPGVPSWRPVCFLMTRCGRFIANSRRRKWRGDTDGVA